MRNVCRGCRFSCHRMDVRCCRQTVVRTRYFSRFCSVIWLWPFTSYKTWACFGVRCSAIPVVVIRCVPQILIFKRVFVCDVESRLVGLCSESRSIKHGF